VPLTSSRGKGVLGRDLLPPQCYPADLYRYGALCVDTYSRHPNVLAGMIGNEVMNNLLTWQSAPCVRAYARDLKRHMSQRMTAQKQEEEEGENENENASIDAMGRRDLRRRSDGSLSKPSYRALPLLYAAQHDSPDAGVLPEAAMDLTASYLTCAIEGEDRTDDSAASTSVDMYGINVESWCSSLQTFDSNEDGSEPGYHALYRTFRNASFPVVFSETGCSRILFNRDNGLPRYVRDWKQVPVILNDMSPVLSGFCAYAYDGNPLFRMMGGDADTDAGGDGSSSIAAVAWDGIHVMEPSPDYYNFRSQLQLANQELASKAVAYASGPTSPRLSCDEAAANLKQVWKLDLVPIRDMPSYVDLVVPLKVVKHRKSTTASAAPKVSPSPPDEPEVFPGQGGMSGAKAFLATMVAGGVLALCCTVLSHRRRRRLGRTGSSSSADGPNGRGGSPQQVSLLQRSDEQREAKSYGAI
jgi:Glucanosyltransferase